VYFYDVAGLDQSMFRNEKHPEMTFNYRSIIFIILVLISFILSYAQDTLFIIINAQLEQEAFNYANTPIPGFLKQFSVPELNRLKWMMAAGFSILFMAVTASAIHIYFRNKMFTRIAAVAYFVLGLLTIIGGLITRHFKFSFQVRSILHIPENLLQSPLVLLIVFAALIFYEKR
jgi:hypothetical protein